MLTRKCRNIVVELLISEIINSKFSMKNDDFERLASKIVEVFPSENCNIYYVPAVKKRHSRDNKSVTSRGKLVDKYRNLVQAYKKLALFGDKKDAKTRQENLQGIVDMDLDTELKESITWLSKNQAPWEVVLSHWKRTSMIRRREIENSNTKSIAEVYIKWPILNHPQGYTLIDVDFSSLGLTEITNDLLTWNTFFDQIKAMNQLNTKDSNAIALNELLELTDINDDTKVAVQLFLLSHMIPPRGRIRVNKKHWKPSISECKDSMIIHATIAGDVAVVQERRINAMKNISLPLQPFIIVVGSDITRISATYVSVDQILYNVPSTIAALDICFKVFHTFHAAYPPESEHLWYILQIALYRVKTKWDKQIPYVAEIISHFESKKDPIG